MTQQKKIDSNNASSAPLAYVGFWVRFLAFVLDSIAIMVLLSIVAVFIPASTDFAAIDLTAGTRTRQELLDFLMTLLPRMGLDALFSALIFLLLWNFIRSSLGKIIFKAYIVDASGNKASFGQLFVRYIGYFVSLAFFGLGFIWIAFDNRKQGWHDKMAGTIVVYGKTGEKEPRGAE